MTLPRIASREKSIEERKQLLEKEKALTRERDALNSERRDLPMVKIEKDYVFRGPEGGRAVAARHVRGTQPADHRALHVQPRLGGRLSELLGRRGGAERRPARAPAHPRHIVHVRVQGGDSTRSSAISASAGGSSRGLPPAGSDFNCVSGGRWTRFRWRRRSTTTRRRTSTSAPARATTSFCEQPRSSSPGQAASCASAMTSSTRTRPSAAAPRCWAAPTTGSTSLRSDARRTGRSEEAEPRACAPRHPTSRAERAGCRRPPTGNAASWHRARSGTERSRSAS